MGTVHKLLTRRVVTNRGGKLDANVDGLRLEGRTFAPMRWKAFVTLQIWFSVTFAVLAVGTVVVVAIGAAPSSQLVTLPVALALVVSGQLAAVKARRHVRDGDPDPVSWTDFVQKL